MSTNRQQPAAFDISNALWNECVLAFQFIGGPVRTALCGADDGGGPLPVPLAGGWWRSLCWQYSLTRLTSPSDFQAVFGAARALLEIAIDAALLQHLPDAPAQMHDWEESAKLKHAEALRRHFNGRGVPPEYAPPIAFANHEGTRIVAARLARGWTKKGKPQHPNRWTDQDLGTDAARADSLDSSLGLSEIYETKYRQMCWYVHGSGSIGIGLNTASFPALGGLMFRTCNVLSITHAKMLLRYAGLWDTAFRGETWPDQFDQLRKMQILTSHQAAFDPARTDAE
jgi:hypothetical protein